MTIKTIIGAFALTALTTSANAASVSLIYTGANEIDNDGAIMAVAGDTLTFDLRMGFRDRRILGGGFDVNWDTAGLGNVEYVSGNFGNPLFRSSVMEL